jgi:hypothetical protein
VAVTETVTQQPSYLSWKDIATKFQCGRNKALLVMHAVGPVYVGNRMFVRSSDVDRKLREDGEIRISWR